MLSPSYISQMFYRLLLFLLLQEQKAELLRICSADDVECLQYHLRAAYGYRPSAGPLPSYAHLGCDPHKDPSCKPKLVQKAPSGLYLQYPNCDPLRDPYCAYAASLAVRQLRESDPPAAALFSSVRLCLFRLHVLPTPPFLLGLDPATLSLRTTATP